MNRSYPEGKRLLLCVSTLRVTLAVLRERDLPNERRPTAGQSEHAHREGHKVSAGPVITFRHVGDVEMSTAGL